MINLASMKKPRLKTSFSIAIEEGMQKRKIKTARELCVITAQYTPDKKLAVSYETIREILRYGHIHVGAEIILFIAHALQIAPSKLFNAWARAYHEKYMNK
jgi:hypothetical protein